MRKFAYFTLRASLAFAFIYPPVAAWFDPFTWLGYIPHFVAIFWTIFTFGLLSNTALLHTFGIVELVLAGWVLWGKNIFIPCALMLFILLFIVVTNVDQFDTLFRDLSIAGLALALMFLNWPKKEIAQVE